MAVRRERKEERMKDGHEVLVSERMSTYSATITGGQFFAESMGHIIYVMPIMKWLSHTTNISGIQRESIKFCCGTATCSMIHVWILNSCSDILRGTRFVRGTTTRTIDCSTPRTTRSRIINLNPLVFIYRVTFTCASSTLIKGVQRKRIVRLSTVLWSERYPSWERKIKRIPMMFMKMMMIKT